jgi:hypothetical protein
MDAPKYLNHCFRSLTMSIDETLQTNGEDFANSLPAVYDRDSADKILETYRTKFASTFPLADEISPEIHRLFLMTARGVLPPLNALLGGVVSQEIIKSITHKFMPINQAMY